MSILDALVGTNASSVERNELVNTPSSEKKSAGAVDLYAGA